MAHREPRSNDPGPPLTAAAQKGSGAESYPSGAAFSFSYYASKRRVPWHLVRIQDLPVNVECLQQRPVSVLECELGILQINVSLNLVALRTHFLLLKLQQIVRRRHTYSKPHLFIVN